ncbi:YceI family protein [Legionella maioricensis]|uniref:YceI family protein n=1 Tax=Legionella maioricensis TaxID=2896528 RepID=A0A9X2D3C1_9GAMM|nr:YceI family protein [Legionella maioricensis]MCL9685708.1 YceI family protein [Legionella maioricensis]MCL9689135.1 YceI family protein [Legionella maioricensis]
MKRNLSCLLALLIAVFSFSAATYAEQETFTLDKNHTYVLWSIKHLGFSTQVGKFYATGQLVLDKDHPDQSKVNATIKIADIATGLPELDKHLKDKLFFNQEKFPTATFVSDKVQVLGKDTAKVQGMLTLHGVTKPVTLDVTLNKTGINPISNKNAVGFTASTEIKRSDFGMNTLLPDLGDEVTIQIGAEAYQDKK